VGNQVKVVIGKTVITLLEAGCCWMCDSKEKIVHQEEGTFTFPYLGKSATSPIKTKLNCLVDRNLDKLT
jgi:hypothetical protein